MADADVATLKVGVAAVGAAAAGVAMNELLKYATGQAIVAGSPLPALTVFGLFVVACWMLSPAASA